MRYKLLGKSGLRVSELCLGTMTFGEDWGWGANLDVSRAQVDLFAEAGGNFIDTSVNYTDGTSETFLGEILDGRREQFVIATKYTLTRPDSTDPNSGGNSRKSMVEAVERSLKRLRTDYIDLYYLHMWDSFTPIEEVMRGLNDLVRAGKVIYIGISDSPSHIVSAANMLAELRGWARFIALQVPYSLVDRDVERALLPTAQYWDMALLAWGIVEGGLLTGKYAAGNTAPKRYSMPEVPERFRPAVSEVDSIAKEVGRSMAQVAINWVFQQQHKAQIIPILGARTVEQLRDNLAVLEWKLSDEQLQRLDHALEFNLGFPHELLHNNHYIYGATRDLTDDHRQGRR